MSKEEALHGDTLLDESSIVIIHNEAATSANYTDTHHGGNGNENENSSHIRATPVRFCVPPRKRLRNLTQDNEQFACLKRSRSDRDNDGVSESPGNTYASPASNASGLSASTNEFTQLVEEASNHPAFPAVLLKLFAVASNRDVSTALPSDVSESIQEADVHLANITETANSSGLEEAVRSTSSSLDIFFAILSAAVSHMNTSGRNNRNNNNNTATLGQVISACEHSCAIPTLWGGLTVPRAKLDARARQVLDTWFDANFLKPYPDEETKEALAKQCGITLSQVATYFANRRMRKKRKMLKTAPNMDDGVIGTNAPALSKWRVAVIAGGAGNVAQGHNINNNFSANLNASQTPTPITIAHRMQQPALPEYPHYHHHHDYFHNQYRQNFQALDPLGAGLVNPSRPPLRNSHEVSDDYGSRCSTPPQSFLR